MSTSRNKDNGAEALSRLTLDTSKSNKKTSKSAKKSPVADSWEDDDESSGSENELKPAVTSPKVPSAPPPTPFTANYGSVPGWNDAEASETASGPGGESAKRPEKTDAVARRMIAAGLGLKAPKQTEEQKAYQRSIKEQEKKKKDQEREEEKRKQEEREKAKAAVWDD
jgi:hypothetical protein